MTSVRREAIEAMLAATRLHTIGFVSAGKMLDGIPTDVLARLVDERRTVGGRHG